MSRLGDEGVQPVLKSLLTNCTLTSLHVGSNDFTEASAPALADVSATHSSVHVTLRSCIDINSGSFLIKGVT